MKTCKYILLFILSLGILSSCVDDKTNYDLNDDGPNIAGFIISSTTLASVADDQEHIMALKIKVAGPSVLNLTNDITVTFGVDEEAMVAACKVDTNLIPAVEGTHYRIDNPSVVLKASNNYLGFFEFPMLTLGIVPPLKKMPVLVLKAISTSGDAKVLNNGKLLTANLSYACYSNLAGFYDVHTVITRAISGAVTEYDWTEKIKSTGIGEYRTSIVVFDGYLEPDDGTPGFTFRDNCDVVVVPEQNLVDRYSNIVVGTAPGSCNTETGIIHIEYSVSTTAAAGNRLVVSDYTRVD